MIFRKIRRPLSMTSERPIIVKLNAECADLCIVISLSGIIWDAEKSRVSKPVFSPEDKLPKRENSEQANGDAANHRSIFPSIVPLALCKA